MPSTPPESVLKVSFDEVDLNKQRFIAPEESLCCFTMRGSNGKNYSSTTTTPPTDQTPFDMIHAEFFDCIGQHYLVVGDRLSGWCNVFQAPP